MNLNVKKLNDIVYSNYENVTLKLSEVEKHIPKIEAYFNDLRNSIEEYIVQDVQATFYRSYFDNIYKVYNTLNTVGGDVINKYKSITNDIYSYKDKLEGKKNKMTNYLQYIDSLYKNDENLIKSMKLLSEQRDIVLIYLVNRYGLVDNIVVLKFYLGKCNEEEID